MTSDDYSTKPIGSWKPLWRWKVFDGLYLCKSPRYDLSNRDWMERWLKLPLFFFFPNLFNGGPLFQFSEQEWWVWGLIVLLIWTNSHDVPGVICNVYIYIYLFFISDVLKKEQTERKGELGGRHFFWAFALSLLSVFFFFFLSGFERKYLTEGAFVCFQMIDLGIWATPLAVQG